MAVPTREQMQADFERTLRTMDQFAAGEAPVQKAAKKLARALGDLGIPYAVAGGLAVAANGVERQTVDVDLLLTVEGLAAFKERWLGLGWVERFQGSKGLRDTEHDLERDGRSASLDEPVRFRRGDVNADRRVDISDAVTILSYLLAGGEEPPSR